MATLSKALNCHGKILEKLTLRKKEFVFFFFSVIKDGYLVLCE